MHTASARLNTYWCLPLRRDGAPLPRWVQSQANWYFGELGVEEELDTALHRHVLVGRFHAEGRTRELLQPLREVKLLLLDRERLVLSGVERDLLTGRDVGQTWLLLPPGVQPGGAGLKFEVTPARGPTATGAPAPRRGVPAAQ